MRTCLKPVLNSLLFLIVSVPIAALSDEGTPDVEVPIKQMRDAMLDAFNRRDIDTVLTYVDPDAVITWQNAEVTRGHEQIKNYYMRMLAAPDSVVVSASAAPVIEGRKIAGDKTLSWGAMHDVFKMRDGSELNLNSRFSAVLTNGEKGWKLAALHLSVNAFDNAMTTKAVRTLAAVAALGGLLAGTLFGWFLASRRKN